MTSVPSATGGEEPQVAQRTSICVVIPAHNAAGVLSEQLDALAGQLGAPPFSVLVVANRCTDSTVSVARSFAQVLDIDVAEANDAAGVSYARNVGARSTASEFIMNCDADDRVHERWVAALAEALTAADLVGGRQVRPNEKFGRWLADEAVYDLERLPSARGVQFAVGCCMAYTRQAFDTVGGFDESFVLGCDDVAFSHSVQRAGLRIGFAPAAVVEYRPRPTMRAMLKQLHRRGHAETVYRSKYTPDQLRRPSTEVVSTLQEIGVATVRTVVPKKSRAGALGVLAERTGRLKGHVAMVRSGEWPPAAAPITVIDSLQANLTHRSSMFARSRFGRRVVVKSRSAMPTREFTAPLGLAVVGGLLFTLPRHCSRSEREFDPELLETLSQYVRPGDRVLHLGAGAGVLTVAASRIVGPAGRVVAVEQRDDVIGSLRANVSRLGTGGTQILHPDELAVAKSSVFDDGAPRILIVDADADVVGSAELIGVAGWLPACVTLMTMSITDAGPPEVAASLLRQTETEITSIRAFEPGAAVPESDFVDVQHETFNLPVGWQGFLLSTPLAAT